MSAQRQAPSTGAAGMVGAFAEVVGAIEPGRPGQVKIQGELWRAAATEPIAAGARVVVTHVDGLTLTVRQT
jgi:membrane protein implicated in regulation of membrane protease activity